MIRSELTEIRNIRQKISEKYDHDFSKLLEHYKELEIELRASGRYQFADSHSVKIGFDIDDILIFEKNNNQSGDVPGSVKKIN